MKSIHELYRIGKDFLKDHTEAGLEAEVLLCKSASLSEEAFYSDGDRKLTRKEERLFLRLLSKRRSGVPLSYLTHDKEFWSLPFAVYPGVLIPRPETELIVEKVIELSSKRKKSSAKMNKTTEIFADIGTGSGNIAISVAKELPEAEIIASDTSRKALRVARLNAQNLRVRNVIFAQGSLFVPLDRFKLQGKCDFIVSNPPYIARKDWETLQPEIRDFEPKRALVAGKTGLEIIRKLVKGASKYLKRGGYLVFEIGYDQKEEVLRLFSDKWSSVRCYNDLCGVPRVFVAHM